MILRTRISERTKWLPLFSSHRDKLVSRVTDLTHELGDKLTKERFTQEVYGAVPWFMVSIVVQILWPIVLEWLRERRAS